MLTFEVAKKRVTDRFPHIELIEFRGSHEPCVIRCAVHGEHRVSLFSNFVRSKHGCPLCAREKSTEGLQRYHTVANNDVRDILTALARAANVSEQDVVQEVYRILHEYRNLLES